MEARRCNILDQGEEPSIDCGKQRTIGLKRSRKRKTTRSRKKLERSCHLQHTGR
ncbi:unnamed protein product [Brassica rapa]|uniref:Uncharacterized protein n=1 Tax=Brassica campestris TaxID=3711 RepID=A0A3P6AP04_BRACM|nr:unnamed protein product [Brassica rapa]VDC95596.1 unnamed protein product [Brassica rapa]